MKDEKEDVEARSLLCKINVNNQVVKSDKFILSNLIHKWNDFNKILRVTTFFCN